MDTLTETPLQITLYKTQLAALEKRAAAQGIAVEELIRQAVGVFLMRVHADAVAAAEYPSEDLTEDELADDPLRAIIGMFNSGLGDLAENHDKYLMDFEVEDNQRWLQSTATAPDSAEADENPVESPLEGFIGLGHSGLNDLSINHDKYLMEFEIDRNQPPPAAAQSIDIP